MTTALLLIDLQRDFLAAPALEPSAGAVVAAAAELLAGWRALGLPVVHVLTTVDRDNDRRMPHWKRTGRWICEAGTPGHETDPRVAPKPGEAVVHKTGFSPFAGGELEQVLAERRVTRLVLAGVHLHGCIRATALDAYQRGFAVWLAADAVASDDPLHAAITRRYLAERTMEGLSGRAVLERLGSLTPRPVGGGTASPDAGVEAACRAAVAALEGWQRQTPEARTALVEAFAAGLEGDRPALVEALARDVGKPVRYGRAEVDFAVELAREAAARCALRQARPGDANDPRVRRRPLGLVALVTPFNNPVGIPVGKLVPALLWGNAVAWKPAPAGTGLARRLMGLLGRAGLAEGLVAMLPGDEAVALAVMSDARVQAITVTGSSALGQAARDVSGRRSIPLQAELGGNNGAVVWSDADLDAAARALAEGAFGCAGQRCTANRRVIVEASCADALVERLAAATAGLRWGDPLHPETVVGPLLSPEARRRAEGFVARARAAGHAVLVPHGQAGPATSGDASAYMAPTLVLCDDPAHEVVKTETFAPIAVVQPARSWDEALALLNGVPQGLAAGLFSRSEARWRHYRDAARAGIVKWNAATAGVAADVPFGGWKASGCGPPEHGDGDEAFYTRMQAVYA